MHIIHLLGRLCSRYQNCSFCDS